MRLPTSASTSPSFGSLRPYYERFDIPLDEDI
jgi:hypothetical protein